MDRVGISFIGTKVFMHTTLFYVLEKYLFKVKDTNVYVVQFKRKATAAWLTELKTSLKLAQKCTRQVLHLRKADWHSHIGNFAV